MVAAIHMAKAVPWPKIFRVSFMYLFLCYPGIALKTMKIAKCINVDGEWYLVADMRLRCFDDTWWSYALYALFMGLVFVVGFPAAIFVILFRHRHQLEDKDVMERWGWLYASYGRRAYLWEVEELLRKLWLTALVVLMNEGSPLQVATAVLVSGWAHVLHSVYKPWKSDFATTYRLQHLSLAVTFFVFLMGLMFKVNGVGHDRETFRALAWMMVALCLAFVLAWLFVVLKALVSRIRAERARGQLVGGDQPPNQSKTRAQVVQWLGDGGGGGGGSRGGVPQRMMTTNPLSKARRGPSFRKSLTPRAVREGERGSLQQRQLLPSPPGLNAPKPSSVHTAVDVIGAGDGDDATD